jgi:hypothetical protein
LATTACGCIISLNLAVAGIQESRFDFSADGANAEFEVRDVPRREVLNRLFADTGIEIRWINAAFADEAMSGMFRGASDVVARQLLAQMNFVIVSDGSDDTPRVTRLIVVGPAKGDQSWPTLSAITTAMAAAIPKRVRKEAPPTAVPAAVTPPADQGRARAIGMAASPLMPTLSPEAAADTTGLMKPPPPDEAAPQPVFTAGMDAPPLIVPHDTMTPFKAAIAGIALPLVPVASDRVNP